MSSQKKVPNKHLSDIVSRVEKKYGIDSAELDDEALGWVSAAGEQNYPLSKKEDEDAELPCHISPEDNTTVFSLSLLACLI